MVAGWLKLKKLGYQVSDCIVLDWSFTQENKNLTVTITILFLSLVVHHFDLSVSSTEWPL